jgi:hypothetical protein
LRFATTTATFIIATLFVSNPANTRGAEVHGDDAGASSNTVTIATEDPSWPPQNTPAYSGDNIVDRWLSMVTATQAEQPHWITPVVTVTPRLEQEFRYDISQQFQPDLVTLDNYGNSKGLEIIPQNHIELLVNPPPYITRSAGGSPDGWGDMSFLMKYRIFSGNEQHGNYILTAFLGGTIPTGSQKNGTPDATISPTIAGGKGWGNFDFSTTLSAILPVDETAKIGRQIVWNTAFQYRLLRKIWPEAEINYTRYSQGADDGKTQVFATPGLVLGKFPIYHRFGFTIGAGMQIAISQFHTYNHKAILTIRYPF